jgi:hypothetical protein
VGDDESHQHRVGGFLWILESVEHTIQKLLHKSYIVCNKDEFVLCISFVSFKL